jgi:hypothetical protein
VNALSLDFLTRMQRIALLDVLLTYARDPNKPQIFHDLATDTEVSVGDLLSLVTDSLLADGRKKA